MRSFVPFVVLVAVSACSSAPPGSSEPPPIAPTAPFRPQVLLEALLVDVPAADRATLTERSLAEVARSPDAHVIATPHLMAVDGMPAEIRISSGHEPSPPSFEWEVRADVTLDGKIRIETTLDVGCGARTRHTFVVASEHTMTLDPSCPAEDARAVAFLVRPRLLRSQEDVRALQRTWQDAHPASAVTTATATSIPPP
jgi:hypothetical protein